jgi:hypothetical protein
MSEITQSRFPWLKRTVLGIGLASFIPGSGLASLLWRVQFYKECERA